MIYWRSNSSKKRCCERAFLTPVEAKKLLNKINLLLPERHQHIGEIIYISPEEIEQQLLTNRKEREKEYKILMEKQKLREEKILLERDEEFYVTYPKFKHLGLTFKSPRSKIISLLYENKYTNIYKSKKEFDKAMKPVIRDNLLEELYISITNYVADTNNKE